MTLTVIKPKRDEMLKCLARFDKLERINTGLPDMPLDGCHRTFLSVLGFQQPKKDGEYSPFGSAVNPAINHLTTGYGVAFVKCEPGQGVLMHNHDTYESFMVVDGKWKMEWEGDNGDDGVVLGPLDFMSFPIGVHRRFECVEPAPGAKEGTLMAVIGGDKPAAIMSKASMDRLVGAGLLPPGTPWV